MPKLIVFPELSLPRTRLYEFEKLIGALNCIAIVGADYELDHSTKSAQNRGIIFVPTKFFEKGPSRYCTNISFRL